MICSNCTKQIKPLPVILICQRNEKFYYCSKPCADKHQVNLVVKGYKKHSEPEVDLSIQPRYWRHKRRYKKKK